MYNMLIVSQAYFTTMDTEKKKNIAIIFASLTMVW